MQYLNVTMDFEEKSRAKPIPESEYIDDLKYVILDVEHNFIFLSYKEEQSNPNQVCIGEL